MSLEKPAAPASIIDSKKNNSEMKKINLNQRLGNLGEDLIKEIVDKISVPIDKQKLMKMSARTLLEQAQPRKHRKSLKQRKNELEVEKALYKEKLEKENYIKKLQSQHEHKLALSLYDKGLEILQELESNQNLSKLNYNQSLNIEQISKISDLSDQIETSAVPNLSDEANSNHNSQGMIKLLDFNENVINKKNKDLEEMLSNISSRKRIYIEHISGVDYQSIGVLYEKYIASLLIQLQYDVKITPLTQDFGVDILASKANIVVAIQCKYWAELVVVCAVQEIYAGRDFYEANKGIVVSHSQFTKNAIALAKKLGIYLIQIKYDSHDMQNLANVLST